MRSASALGRHARLCEPVPGFGDGEDKTVVKKRSGEIKGQGWGNRGKYLTYLTQYRGTYSCPTVTLKWNLFRPSTIGVQIVGGN